jgi:hypothetical protein
MDYEVAAEATPFYQATAVAALKNVMTGTANSDTAWEQIEERRTELQIPETNSKELLSSMVMQALGAPLEETNKFAKVNNEAAVYDHLLEALEAKQVLIAILTKSGWDEFDNFDQTFCDPWDRQSANGFLKSEERIKMYRIFLTRSVRKAESGKISDEMFDQITQIKGLLGISDDQAEVEARGAFGPELQKACLRATTEIVQDYTPELAKNMQKDIDGIMENYRLSEDFLREIGASYYSKAVTQIGANVSFAEFFSFHDHDIANNRLVPRRYSNRSDEPCAQFAKRNAQTIRRRPPRCAHGNFRVCLQKEYFGSDGLNWCHPP